MPRLLEFQREFRKALVEGGQAPIPIAARHMAIGTVERMGLYRNNILENLKHSLWLTYPAVARLVGSESFSGAASQYVAMARPKSANLYAYGDGFPNFLADLPSVRCPPYLPDVARLEWAFHVAEHAPILPALDAGTLSDKGLEKISNLRLVPHPSLSLLELAYPAHEIWEAVLTDDVDARSKELSAIDPSAGGEMLAVLSADGEAKIIHLTVPALALARALTAGRPLAGLLNPADLPDLIALVDIFLTHGFFCETREFSWAGALA